MSEYRGRRACVLGLGRSGFAAARLLLRQGARVRAIEERWRDELAPLWQPLAASGAELAAGEPGAEALRGCELLVRSPGVPSGNALLRAAREAGIEVVSEIELAAREMGAVAGPRALSDSGGEPVSSARVPAVLAITGTNGKSTTTAWAAHLLERAGTPAIACGNIGHALADAWIEDPGRVFVAEISSFQLEDSPTFRPRAATILNITPDHLDRYPGYDAYRDAKWAIARSQTRDDVLVLGPDLFDEGARRAASVLVECDVRDHGRPDALFVRDGAIHRRAGGRETRLLAVSELALPGPHNLLNAMAAFALGAALVPDAAALVRGLRDFPGLPHRLEQVGVLGAVRFINDSKATNVDSMRVALESFAEPIVLIAGGRDKAGDFEAIAPLVEERVARIIAIGEAAGRVRRAYPRVPSETAPDFASAIERAYAAAAQARGVVLLSPGCASFDWFRNYEHRGDVFRDEVAALIRREAGRARGEA